MIDERERYGRVVDGFTPPADAFERLLDRRDRRERNRRIRAGAVGILMALATGLVLFRLLAVNDVPPADRSGEPRPAPAAAGTLAYILDGDVYTAGPDGSNAVKILNGRGEDCAPARGFSYWAEGSMWSPDGRYLAFRRVDCSSEEPGGEDWGDVVITDAAGTMVGTFPADGWDIGWSPDSTDVAVWDELFSTVGVYGVDGTRQAKIAMPQWWQPSGDHDPAWLEDGTLAVDDVELPLDGTAPRHLDSDRANEWRDRYSATIGMRVESPDGSLIATTERNGRSLVVRGSAGSASTRQTVLTVDRGATLSIIAFSPLDDRILFSKREDPDRSSLWSVGADGSDPGLVVDGTMDGDLALSTLASLPSDDGGPTVEPSPRGSGEVLVAVGMRDLGAQDPGTGTLRTIVEAETLPGGCSDECSFGESEAITGAAWSFDRSWVAFRAGGLWVADTSGGAPRQLTADQGWDPWAWSPTENRLVVVRGRTVTLIDATTGRASDLGTTSGPKDGEGVAVQALAWSPDGTRVAYGGGPGGGSVYSIDVTTGEQSLVVREPTETGEIKDIDWSPDGGHLAITYLEGATYLASHEAELGDVAHKAKAMYVANADGSDLRLVDHIVASQWSVWIPGHSVGTAWSPDGTRLAYATFTGTDHQELQIRTSSVDGSAPSVVATHCCVADGGGPVWSPDGSRIAFESEPPGDVPHDFLAVTPGGTGVLEKIDESTYRSWLGGSYFCLCYG